MITNESISLELDEIKDICRICLQKPKLLYFSIFKSQIEDQFLYEVLQTYTLQKIEENDFCPESICGTCTKDLEHAHSFIQKCRNANELLLSLTNVLNSNKQALEVNNPAKDIEHVDMKFTEYIGTNDNDEIDKLADSLQTVDPIPDEEPIQNVLHRKSRTTKSGIKKAKSKVQNICKSNDNTKGSRNPDLQLDIYHIPDKPYVCQVCPASFSLKGNLNRHERQHSATNRHVCKTCGKSYTRKINLTEHMLVHTGELPYHCQYCGKKTRKYSYHRQHLMQHQLKNDKILTEDEAVSQPPIKTEKSLAPDSVENQTIASDHRYASDTPKIKCHQCPILFQSKSDFKAHLSVHADCKNLCDECGKNFPTKHALLNHCWLHKNEKLFECGFCTEKFAVYDSLKQHVAGHVEAHKDKEFLCDKCPNKYSSRDSWRLHMRTVHGEHRYLCSQCGKRFTNAASLQKHLVVHSDEIPYSCNLCNKKFKFQSNYRFHMRTHTGIKPHVCKICNKAFMQPYNLKCHLITHSGEKPYACSFCNRAFALKVNLKVHTRMHTGETPFLCPICNRGFYDSSSMKKHKEKHIVNENVNSVK